MKRAILTLIIVFLFLPGPGSQAADRDILSFPDAYMEYREGMKLLKQKRCREAIRRFEAAMNSLPFGEGANSGRAFDQAGEAQRKAILCAARQAEKGRKFREAAGYYGRIERYDDAGRCLVKHAEARPLDMEAFKHSFSALEFYARESKDAAVDGHLSRLRGIARAYGNRLLERAGKKFDQALRQSNMPGELEDKMDVPLDLEEKAIAFLAYAGRKKDGIRLAISHGDRLLGRGDQARYLETARKFYELANAGSRLKSLKKKAASLGRKAEREGNFALAARYYSVAGDEDRSAVMIEKAGKREGGEPAFIEPSEDEKREFDRETDELEKELGL